MLMIFHISNLLSISVFQAYLLIFKVLRGLITAGGREESFPVDFVCLGLNDAELQLQI